MNKKNVSPLGENWSSYRKEHFTAEELAENDLMVTLIGEVIRARKEHITERAGKHNRGKAVGDCKDGKWKNRSAVVHSSKAADSNGKNTIDCAA